MANDFYSVLTAAIADMAEHGFDSSERVANWMRKLREAAEGSMISEEALGQALRDHLGRTFERMVEQGGMMRMHPGVPRFTIDRIKPSLRGELDRRIMAATDLIKLNRAQAVDKTLLRFAGWSTSIPAGGIDQANRAKVKKDVRKSLAQLPFEERRVLIDQGHKLVSSISDLVATDGGAIAGEWHDRGKHDPSYDAREEHLARTGKIYLVRGSWAHKGGLVKPTNGFTDDIERPAELPYCSCWYRFIYTLRDLPAEMVTDKGRDALEHARAVIRGQSIRADSDEKYSENYSRSLNFDESAEVLVRRAIASYTSDDHDLVVDLATKADRLQYLRGIKAIRRVPDRSKWHAYYDTDKDEIVVEDKLFHESIPTRVQMFLHEVGHRGQEVDRQTYDAFKAARFHKRQDFIHMANDAHLEEFKRTGRVDSGMLDEVFAESYSRFMLGLAMPGELKRFWEERCSQT